MLILLILVSLSVRPAPAGLRTWTGGYDRISKTSTAHCKGVQLPEAYEGVIVLSSDTMGELVLPDTGGVAFQDGAQLLFDEKGAKCTEIQIKQPYVNRPENWNALPNRAVPYLDRLPCQWDSVLIPSADILGIVSLPMAVKSFTLFNQNLTSDDASLKLFSTKLASDNTCTKDTCPCQEPLMSDLNDRDQCEFINTQVLQQTERFRLQREEANQETIFRDEPFCKNPITTPRSCQKICGSVIILRETSDLKILQKIKQVLHEEGKNGDNVDYYTGLFFDVDKQINFRQVVIVDKDAESGGRHTLEVVKKIEAKLEKEAVKEDFYFYNIMTSGEPIILVAFANSGAGMLLMTFLLTVLVFLGIYLVFMTPIKQFDVRHFRINPTNFRPFLFARFDNAGDASDGEEEPRRVDISFSPAVQAAAGDDVTAMSLRSSTLSTVSSSSQADNASVVREGASLERSDREFDNPLYGRQFAAPSASAGDDETFEEEGPDGRLGRNAHETERAKKGRKHAFEQSLRDEDEEIEDVGEEMRDLQEQRGHESERQAGTDPRVEMFKILEDNMQQVNLLEDADY